MPAFRCVVIGNNWEIGDICIYIYIYGMCKTL